MGCADGLAQEFRRRIANVPLGGSLEVVVSDPAAKEDLPSLARLLGQRVTSTEAHDDGASPSLWRDRNEREAHLHLHLGP